MQATQSGTQPAILATALNKIMGKWDLIVCFILLDNEFRMNDIQQVAEQLSGRKLYTSSLTPTVNKLMKVGIISKTLQRDTIPFYTTYSLTQMGEELRPILTKFIEWGSKWI